MALTETTLIPEWTMGERFAKARKHAGLNQEKMAERLAVKPSTLAAWESDRSRPRDLAGIAQQWSEVTGVDPPGERASARARDHAHAAHAAPLVRHRDSAGQRWEPA